MGELGGIRDQWLAHRIRSSSLAESGRARSSDDRAVALGFPSRARHGQGRTSSSTSSATPMGYRLTAHPGRPSIGQEKWRARVRFSRSPGNQDDAEAGHGPGCRPNIQEMDGISGTRARFRKEEKTAEPIWLVPLRLAQSWRTRVQAVFQLPTSRTEKAGENRHPLGRDRSRGAGWRLGRSPLSLTPSGRRRTR